MGFESGLNDKRPLHTQYPLHCRKIVCFSGVRMFPVSKKGTLLKVILKKLSFKYVLNIS
jgi:hypothetical protein